MEIGEPALLAKLPKAGLSGDGRTRFCQVLGVRNGQNKKRHEICAAVDGNSLSIYEVVNGKNVASWPVPPDSTFMCQPYSARLALSDGYVRKSWCVVRRRGQLSLQYFEQSRRDNHVDSREANYALNSQKDILKIEPLDTVQGDVLVIHEDGALTICQSAGTMVSQHLGVVGIEGTIKLRAAQCLSVRDAKLSTLKARQDILSTLLDDALVVVGAFESLPAGSLHLAFWALPLTSDRTHTEPTNEALASYVLERGQSQGTSRRTEINFVSGATRLEFSTPSSVVTFDLTSIVPVRLSNRKHLVSDQLSSLDLGHDVHLFLTAGQIQIYSKKFVSLLATTSFSSSTLKRKRDGENTTYMSCIAYFSQIRRVLVCNGNQLLAVDIHAGNEAQDPFKQSSLLSGNILRGSEKAENRTNFSRSSPEASYAIGKTHREKSTKDWTTTVKELDALAEANDTKGFESRFSGIFNLQKAKDFNASKVPESKIDYLLSKVFAITAAGDDQKQQLSVRFLPSELLRWCISGGYLDNHRVLSALDKSRPTMASTAVAQALINVDASAELLEHYIQRSPFLQAEVLTFIAKCLVRKVTEQSGDEVEMKTVSGTSRAVSARRASQQISLESRVDEPNTSTPTTTCLAYTLKRLAFTGPSTVSQQLRTAGLDQKDILALIQFLRQQLFLGGYSRLGGLRHYPSPPTSEADDDGDHSTNSNPQISLGGIVILLNGCIDSIGPVGILGSAEHEAFIRRMVPELLSEVSSASQAVDDSTYLQGLLRETLRYAESVERQPFEVRSKVENKSSRDAAQKGRIVTLYTERDSSEPGRVSATALPLSLRAEEDIDAFKTRKGGQVHRRSAREIGMLKDRLKSPYSFERLVL